MSTIKVSSQSQLRSELQSARGGDTILLESGDYGALDLNGRTMGNLKGSGTITIASANDSRPAEFSRLDLTQVSGLKVEGVVVDGSASVMRSDDVVLNDIDFEGRLSGGYGEGTGLRVGASSDVRVENSSFKEFSLGAQFWGVDDVVFRNNDFEEISKDAIVFGDARNVLIQGNDVEMDSRPGVKHRDMIQVWNESTSRGSSDITIRDNTLEAGESETHGIYMGNAAASRSGNKSSFYEDILIENNTVRSGQTLGIAVGETDGLVIRDNVVLQHGDVNGRHGSDIPVIRVDQSAEDVRISGNTTHSQPVAAGGNWQPVNGKGGDWTISGNKTVPLGTSGQAQSSGKDDGPAVRSVDAPTPARDSGSGNGDAEVFRFAGSSVDGGARDRLALDFAEGDRLVLTRYDRGTFDDVSGGNIVHNSKGGGFVRIDSLTDLQELADSSRDISASTSGDDLVLNIRQDDGVHRLTLDGLGREYQQSFDDSLF